MGHEEYIIYILLSQRGPKYPCRHVQVGYPVDLLTAHDPLFRHGEDELQMSAEKNPKNCNQSVRYSEHWSVDQLAN